MEEFRRRSLQYDIYAGREGSSFRGMNHSLAAPGAVNRIPPHGYFLVSAVFHYLGPAFAVLLFAHIAPLGVAWLRIASAALIFAVWRRPWRYLAACSAHERRIVIA